MDHSPGSDFGPGRLDFSHSLWVAQQVGGVFKGVEILWADDDWWLLFEMSILRNSSFNGSWIYALVMTAAGLLYLGYLLARRGLRGLAMPDLASIDSALADPKSRI